MILTPDDLLRAARAFPDLKVVPLASHATYRVLPREASAESSGPKMDVRFDGRLVHIEDSWQLGLEGISREDAARRVLDLARLFVRYHGASAPAILKGGPRDAERLMMPWRDAPAWHLFSVNRPRFDVYKWHLEVEEDGTVPLVYERTVSLAGLPAFAAKNRPAVTRTELPARADGDKGLPLFQREPYVSLGWDFLQECCEEWVKSPVAREAGMRWITLGGGPRDLGLNFALGVPKSSVGGKIVVPFDDLVRTILRKSSLPPEVRAEEEAHMRSFWAQHPDVFRHYVAGGGTGSPAKGG